VAKGLNIEIPYDHNKIFFRHEIQITPSHTPKRKIENKMWRKSREEKRDYLNLTWLKHYYYDLGMSLQNIANDQGVSMMTIKKWVDKIEKPNSGNTEEKSLKTCPSCKQKLYLKAKFCINCGKKFEEDQVTTIRSEERSKITPDDQFFPELLKNRSSQKLVTEEVPPIQVVSEKKEEKGISEVSQIKTEEKQPVPPVSDKKFDILERLKEISPLCKFCGMDLNKKAPFCPQCGTRIKKK